MFSLAEFSGPTVVALLCQIIVIIVDRYWFFIRPMGGNNDNHSEGNKAQIQEEKYNSFNFGLMGKFVTHLVLFIWVHIFVFWVIPNHANKDNIHFPECQSIHRHQGICAESNSNVFLLWFYLLYCIYFLLSAAQIRYGWPQSVMTGLTTTANQTNKLISTVFYSLPFVWELQAIACWLWTRTSFDIFQWIKFEEIHSSLFIAKCNAKAKILYPVGTENPLSVKRLMGGCGLFILILLIVGPIVLFSTLNPLSIINNPYTATIGISLKYASGNSFELFKRGGAKISNITENDQIAIDSRNEPDLRSQTIDQFVKVEFFNSSDSNTLPSQETRFLIVSYFGTIQKSYIALKLAMERHVLSSNIYNRTLLISKS